MEVIHEESNDSKPTGMFDSESISFSHYMNGAKETGPPPYMELEPTSYMMSTGQLEGLSISKDMKRRNSKRRNS